MPRPLSGQLAIPAGSTATVTGPDIPNELGHRGVKVVVVTTAIGTGSWTVSIQSKDRASGTYVTLLTGVAIITNTTNVYTVFPGAPTTANVFANDSIGEIFRVVQTSNSANPVTGTVGWSTLP